MKFRGRKNVLLLLSGIVLTATVITSCSSGTTGNPIVNSESLANAQAAAAVPQSIKDAGELRVRFVENSPPGSFRSATGITTGWEIELGSLLAERMALKLSMTVVPFDQVIPGVVEGASNIGMASMFDTPAREELVDFVNYFEGGTGWATYKDSGFSPTQACGKTVGVRSGTAQYEQFLPAKSAACIDAGAKAIEIIGFPDEITAADALKSQEVDAIVADSPVVSYLVGQSLGGLVRVGSVEGIQPYGIAVAKGNEELITAIRLALNSLIADGTYERLLGKWGVETGAISEATTNLGGR